MLLIKYKDKEIVVHAYNGIKRNDLHTETWMDLKDEYHAEYGRNLPQKLIQSMSPFK